ncbi:MAG: hypothetical protein JNL57_08560 [Bacteroidetes bacterium]|nr:hypothetical protein [Bacteroidota bacterium]
MNKIQSWVAILPFLISSAGFAQKAQKDTVYPLSAAGFAKWYDQRWHALSKKIYTLAVEGKVKAWWTENPADGVKPVKSIIIEGAVLKTRYNPDKDIEEFDTILYNPDHLQGLGFEYKPRLSGHGMGLKGRMVSPLMEIQMLSSVTFYTPAFFARLHDVKKHLSKDEKELLREMAGMAPLMQLTATSHPVPKDTTWRSADNMVIMSTHKDHLFEESVLLRAGRKHLHVQLTDSMVRTWAREWMEKFCDLRNETDSLTPLAAYGMPEIRKMKDLKKLHDTVQVAKYPWLHRHLPGEPLSKEEKDTLTLENDAIPFNFRPVQQFRISQTNIPYFCFQQMYGMKLEKSLQFCIPLKALRKHHNLRGELDRVVQYAEDQQEKENLQNR